MNPRKKADELYAAAMVVHSMTGSEYSQSNMCKECRKKGLDKFYDESGNEILACDYCVSKPMESYIGRDGT